MERIPIIKPAEPVDFAEIAFQSMERSGNVIPKHKGNQYLTDASGFQGNTVESEANKIQPPEPNMFDALKELAERKPDTMYVQWHSEDGQEYRIMGGDPMQVHQMFAQAQNRLPELPQLEVGPNFIDAGNIGPMMSAEYNQYVAQPDPRDFPMEALTLPSQQVYEQFGSSQYETASVQGQPIPFPHMSNQYSAPMSDVQANLGEETVLMGTTQTAPINTGLTQNDSNEVTTVQTPQIESGKNRRYNKIGSVVLPAILLATSYWIGNETGHYAVEKTATIACPVSMLMPPSGYKDYCDGHNKGEK